MHDQELEDLGSNQIECAHCGASFYYELTRCPQCGVSIYPQEEENWQPNWRPPANGNILAALQLLLLAFAGWFAASALSIPLYFILRSMLPAAFISEAMLSSISTALGSLCGGFLAGYLAHRSHAKIGLAVGGLAISIYLLLLASTTGSLLGNSLLPTLAGGAAILLAGIGGAQIAGHLQRKTLVNELFSLHSQPDEVALYHDLLAKAGHDPQVVERLVDYEQQRDPHASRSMLLREAIRRWERDNRPRS